MAKYSINISELADYADVLRAGDEVLLSGTAYTARDAAHKRIFSLLDSNEKLPFELRGACIYFAGPTPTPTGAVIGSCGPTTSGRMDCYSPRLLDLGLAAMIGKGDRSDEVYDALKRNGAIYFCAVGGAGALYSKHIVSCREIAFKDLGCESVKELVLSNFPVFVGIDARSDSLFRKKHN